MMGVLPMRDRSMGAFPEDLVRTSMLRVPLRCTNNDSWHGHIPFAFWCIEALEPRLLVELGCQKGDSYCAFCQAVEEISADTRCYGVGTWSDDSHAGFYGDEVYEELRQYNDSRYGRFSSLLRSTFDEALSNFRDASIDLLHIDGSRGYEEARHDFATWLPKISRSGVVLFHHIAVREAGFGVRRLWEEIRHTYPSFSFPHSRGLGVLAVGASPPEALRRLTNLDDGSTEDVRQLFGRLGDAVRLHGTHQALARHRVRIAELQVSLQERDQRIAELQASLQERDQRIVSLDAELAKLYRSTSWKVSAPLRFAARLLGRGARARRRSGSDGGR
jgi:hypothetical protein